MILVRFVKLNQFNIVEEIREGAYAEMGEIESETGQIGQRMLEDGTFVDVPIEPIETTPTELELIQAQILLNTEMLLIYKEFEMEMM